MAEWPEKLEDLRKQHDSSAEQLADMLGITTRTLSDLMGGREPTKPIQRLVDNLLNSNLLSGERSKPYLNLVLIHSDFKVFKDDSDNTVDSVITPLIALNADASRITAIADSRQSEAFRNEYHYIAAPDDHEASMLYSALMKKKVQPHFLTYEVGADTKKTLDVFFTATAMKLVSKTLSQKLAHVTIAADIEKFWSLGKGIQEDQNVGVTFVRQYGVQESDSLIKSIEQCQIIDPPLGRCSGIVTSIHPGGFGFIKDSDDSNKPGLFFSWNHMRLDENGIPELDIQQLKVGDKVSYTIGVNNKGPCATNVAIVERLDQTRSESVPITSKKQQLTSAEQDFLKNKLTDAICLCADSDGWALLADVGSRIKLMFPQATENLNSKGYKWSKLVEEMTEFFEYNSDGRNTNRSAACVRIKKLAAGKK
ncbi:MAG: cold shock domain-containing protein [Methylococcaceae bacterium]